VLQTEVVGDYVQAAVVARGIQLLPQLEDRPLAIGGFRLRARGWSL
jgi:hypothetical protein